MSVAFRFLHLSDLKLGEPISGVRQPTDSLKQSLLSAPYSAAETAFDTAVREQVDFVLLTGNVLDLQQPSPKPLSFLQKQFKRLLTEGIEVYWCSGALDPLERWPRSLELPQNVTVFATAGVEAAKIQNDKGSLCSLLASGHSPTHDTLRPVDFRAISDTGFVIGAAHGRIDLDAIDELPCHYWALGGQDLRKAVAKGNRLAVYSGTPQARSPQQTGACGANFVSVDPNRSIHSKEIACDQLRFTRMTIDADGSRLDKLKETLGERMLELAAESDDRWTVVSLTLNCESNGPGQFPTATQQQTLVQWLRKEFSGKSGGVWCNELQVKVHADRIGRAIMEEDSILGDFLRSLPEWEEDADRVLDMTEYQKLSAELQAAGWSEKLADYDRAELLARVRRLGIELLGGVGS